MKNLISIIIPSFSIGGAEKSLCEIANGLCEIGWNVDIVLVSSSSDAIGFELNSAINIFNLYSNSYRKFTMHFARYLNLRQPNVVITSIYATGLAAILARFLSNAHSKIIVGCHNSLLSKINRPDNIKDKYLLFFACKLLFRFADGLIAVSKGVKLELCSVLKLPEERVKVIYNPVNLKSVREKMLDPVDHFWLSNKKGRNFFTLVSVGRLVEQKGFDLLLHSFKLVLDKGINCKLIIVGGGPLLSELISISKKLNIEEHVCFVGEKYNPYKYMYNSDLFVLASRWEGLGNVLIEALACGCNVVATNCNYGPSEILVNENFGLLALPNSPKDISIKIVQALLSSKEFNRDTSNVENILETFSSKFSVSSYNQYINEIISD